MATQEEQGTSSSSCLLRRREELASPSDAGLTTATTSTADTASTGRNNKESTSGSSSLLLSSIAISPAVYGDDGLDDTARKRQRRDSSINSSTATSAQLLAREAFFSTVAKATTTTADSHSTNANKDKLIIENLKARLVETEGERDKEIERSKLLEANNTALTKAIDAVTSLAMCGSGNKSSSDENEAKRNALEQENEELVEKLTKVQSGVKDLSKELAASKATHLKAKEQFERDLSDANNTIRRLQEDKDELIAKASSTAGHTKLLQDEYSKTVEDINMAEEKLLRSDRAIRTSYLIALEHLGKLSTRIRKLEIKPEPQDGYIILPFDDEDDEEDSVTVRFQDQFPFNKDVVFQLKMSAKMSEVFKAYALQQRMMEATDVLRLRFLFCGEGIVDCDTPEMLELENGDAIDVVYEQPFNPLRFLSSSNHGLRDYCIQDLRKCLEDEERWKTKVGFTASF